MRFETIIGGLLVLPSEEPHDVRKFSNLQMYVGDYVTVYQREVDLTVEFLYVLVFLL